MHQNVSDFNLSKLSPDGTDDTRCPIPPSLYGARTLVQSKWVQVCKEMEVEELQYESQARDREEKCMLLVIRCRVLAKI